MIHIYRVINSFIFFIFISINLFAEDEANSFCFEKNVSVYQVENVISFLVAGNDKINLREKDHCLDILTTPSRLKLYEKIIWKNFRPIENSTESNSIEHEGSLNEEHCRLEIDEIRKTSIESLDTRLSPKLKLEKSEINKNGKTSQELMISRGKSAEMKVGDQLLQVQCVKTLTGIYQLTIFLDEKNKNTISTSVNLKNGETVNLGNIKKELNDKSRALGLNIIETKEQSGNDEITYELKMK